MILFVATALAGPLDVAYTVVFDDASECEALEAIGYTEIEEDNEYRHVPNTPLYAVPRVAVNADWRETRLGSCSAEFDSKNRAIWGDAGDDADASMRVLAVSWQEVWIEIRDDTWVDKAESWLHTDHLEIWGSPGGNGCEAGSAIQWAIPLDGSPALVAHGKEEDVPVVEHRSLKDGARAVRITLPWWSEGLAVHYSDSDDGKAQERLIGTNALRVRGAGANLAPIRRMDLDLWCEVADGVLEARAFAGRGFPKERWPNRSPARFSKRLPCPDCERFDAGADAEGHRLSIVRLPGIPGDNDGPPSARSCALDLLEIRDGDTLKQTQPVAWMCGDGRGMMGGYHSFTAVVGPNSYAQAEEWSVGVKSGGSASKHQLHPWKPLESSSGTIIEGIEDDGAGPKTPTAAAVAGAFGARLGGCDEGYDAKSPVWGEPSDPGDARLRAVVVAERELWVEVEDDKLDGDAKSWVNRDHLELWVQGPAQWAIDAVTGDVMAGHGAEGPPPQVERNVIGTGVLGFRIALSEESPKLTDGAAIVYSDADKGKQERLVGTLHFKPDSEAYLPGFGFGWSLCREVEGRLERVALPPM